MIKVRNGELWICCPNCGKSVHKIFVSTRAEDMPFWCKKCKQMFILNINIQL